MDARIFTPTSTTPKPLGSPLGPQGLFLLFWAVVLVSSSGSFNVTTLGDSPLLLGSSILYRGDPHYARNACALPVILC